MQGIESLDYTIQSKIPIPEGGLQTIKNAANMLADFGREGDIYIVHAAEGETVVPMEVLNSSPRLKNMLFKQMEELGLEPDRYVVGNKLNSINPVTGQPEFFLKKISKAVKRVAKVAKKVAPIVLPAVAPFLLPTMPVAFATGLGSLAGGLISGQSFKDSLRNAVISGGLAGLGNVAFGNMGQGAGQGFGKGSFFGSYANPTGGLGDVSFRQAFTPRGFGTMAANQNVTSDMTVKNLEGNIADGGIKNVGDANKINVDNINKLNVDNTDKLNLLDDPPDTRTFTEKYIKDPFKKFVYDPAENVVTYEKIPTEDSVAQLKGTVQGEGYLESLLSPKRVSIRPEGKIMDVINQTNEVLMNLDKAGLDPSLLKGLKEGVAANITKAASSGAPSMLAKFGPAAGAIATVGGGIYALTGEEEPVDNDGDGVIDGFNTPGGQQLLIENPQQYGFSLADFYGSNPYYQDRIAVADGGMIEGPGTPTSDSIPAMLSDGEFVMNAKAVRGAGGGNRVEGAKRMYAMMRDFEKRSA